MSRGSQRQSHATNLFTSLADKTGLVGIYELFNGVHVFDIALGSGQSKGHTAASQSVYSTSGIDGMKSRPSGTH